MRYITLFTLLTLCLTLPSSTDARKIAPAGECTFQENTSVNVSYNGMLENARSIHDLIEERNSTILKLAKEAGVEKINMQSQNYNVNYNPYHGGQFNYSGNANFIITPADKAMDFVDLLAKKNYQFSLNVNKHKRGACN